MSVFNVLMDITSFEVENETWNFARGKYQLVEFTAPNYIQMVRAVYVDAYNVKRVILYPLHQVKWLEVKADD